PPRLAHPGQSLHDPLRQRRPGLPDERPLLLRPRLLDLPPLALLPPADPLAAPCRGPGPLGDGGGGDALPPPLHDRRGGGLGGDVQPVRVVGAGSPTATPLAPNVETPHGVPR